MDASGAALLTVPCATQTTSQRDVTEARCANSIALCVGIITSEPETLSPLLRDLDALTTHVRRLVVVVLDNASEEARMARLVASTRSLGLEVIVIRRAEQRFDAARGAFGTALRSLPEGRTTIAQARTMLQRYVGAWMASEPHAVAWLLDDDMRVDRRALRYLSWLPVLRDAGVDVLLGALEGASPNPPLHGIQGQLFDLVHNLSWLRGLPASSLLPDRTRENAAMRARFPDYYYDLSRRHSEHLRTVFWLEPDSARETVSAAYKRLVKGAPHIVSGRPLTRRLVAPEPIDPIAAAEDSVNRGGNTFVFDRRALTSTPNAALRADGRETRRSDMLWAIVNRHYRCMTIKAVAFPVVHVGRAADAPHLDTAKVASELVGAALYAALTEFLSRAPLHELAFSPAEVSTIGALAERHRERRVAMLGASLARVAELRAQLLSLARPGEFDALLAALDGWLAPRTFEEIHEGVISVPRSSLESLLQSLRTDADDLASAPAVDLGRLRVQPREEDRP